MLENLLIPQEWEYYIKELSKLTDGSVWALVHAAPDKRCVAWIATKERKSNGPTKEL
jgi:hypothetical protein